LSNINIFFSKVAFHYQFVRELQRKYGQIIVSKYRTKCDPVLRRTLMIERLRPVCDGVVRHGSGIPENIGEAHVPPAPNGAGLAQGGGDCILKFNPRFS
jgi:hypothetical protein